MDEKNDGKLYWFLSKNTYVVLSNNISLYITHYHFVSQLLCLLQNQQLMIQEDSSIDVNDPCKMFKSTNVIIGDALSGKVYCDVY